MSAGAGDRGVGRITGSVGRFVRHYLEMAVAMAAWMGFRGHRAQPIVEMSLARYAGFVVLFPLLWSGRIDAAA